MKKILIFLILTASLSFLFADGVYIPERAIRNIPKIPAQRAFISWKDKKETLIISSALDSEAQTLGWIIPLPNEPERIEKIQAGALKTLVFCVQPEIIHDLYMPLKIVAIVSVFILLVAGAAFSSPEKRFDYFGFFLVVFLWAIILLGGFAAASSHMSAGGGKILEVDVLKTSKVGNYQITVLSARKADALNDWLRKNGLRSLPESSRKIVDDYIKRKWVFALIKLLRRRKGKNAPHPIKMQFKSERIVYPMKLTSLAGGKTFFELFVIAPESVDCKELSLEFCDEYREYNDPNGIYLDGTYFTGKTYRQGIGVPELCELMWNSCVLSKFSGSLTSGAMKDDLYFKEKEFVPYQDTFYTVYGACCIALMVLIGLADMLILIFFIVWKKERKVLNNYTKKWLPLAAGIVLLVFLIVYFSLPKIRNVLYSGYHPEVISTKMAVNSFGLAATLTKHSSLNLTREKLKKIIDSDFPGLRENHIQGGVLLEEASPGNYTLEDKGKGHFILTFYDFIGRPIIHEISPEKEIKKKKNGK